jgi:REP element-mobilizing transposase RayT
VITAPLRDRLWPYLGGIARTHGMKSLAVGGVEDHVPNILLSLPSTINVAKALQRIKGGSSKWVHDTFPENREFAWQEGYGAFSIGISQVDATVSYINRQAEHHQEHSFQDEFIGILERHQIPYDPRYLWD